MRTLGLSTPYKSVGIHYDFKVAAEHLLQHEYADRAIRSVNHQMNMAKLPMHRDFAVFDFSAYYADCIRHALARR